MGDRLPVLDRTQLPQVNSQVISGAIRSFKRKSLATRIFVVIDAIERCQPVHAGEKENIALKHQMNDLLQLTHQEMATGVMVTVGDWRSDVDSESKLVHWMPFLTAFYA